jgi:arylsulfatase A-like enzyme
MGFNELGYRNTTRGLQTPNIDALAAGGVTLSRYYTTPLCSPSRSSLMTGIYNHRIGTQANVIYWGACARQARAVPSRESVCVRMCACVCGHVTVLLT